MPIPDSGRTLRSGELARLTGVSRDTLRLYERRGLLPAPGRSESGYRRYGTSAAHRVRLIRAALSIGFTIDELGEIFAARDRGLAPCRRVHALAIQKASSLEARVTEMQSLLGALRLAIRDWDQELTRTGPHERAGLLEKFLALHPESTASVSPMMSPGLKDRLQRRRGHTQ
jgi:DNA-binding transcriptional MerR regulator